MPAKGGSIQGELEALNRLLRAHRADHAARSASPARTLVVPGHGHVSDYAELVEYRDMVTIIKDTIEDLINKGMTLEQVKAANPTQGYRGRYGTDSGPWTTDMFVEAIYNGSEEIDGHAVRLPELAVRSIALAARAGARNATSQRRGARARGARRTRRAPTHRSISPGYWVAIISEDWRWRMVTPAEGRLSPASRSASRAAASPRRGIRRRTKPPASSAKRTARPA